MGMIAAICKILALALFLSLPLVADGRLIVFAGISGTGKSTLARELAELTHGKYFLEPEESEWPAAVKNSHIYGEFSAMMAMRALRLESLYRAQEMKQTGHMVFVDSYYDKSTSYYIGKPGMEWLIHPNDPYFGAARLVTQIDTEQLPDADCIVLLDVDVETWTSFLDGRGRERDKINGFRESYALYRSYVEDAALRLSSDRSIRLVRFQQQFGDPRTQALRLKELLLKEGILAQSLSE